MTSITESNSGPIRIGSDKQLFLGPWAEDGRDDHLVESMHDVEMTENEAHVTGECLMVQETPWEGTGILDMRQFVIRDTDRFRMYYSALPYSFVREGARPKEQYSRLWEEPYQRILCYAESEDGIRWDRPDLGLSEWDGSRKTNILFPNDDFPYVFSEMEGAWVFLDPNARGDDDRYKMICKMTPVGKGGTEDRGPEPERGMKSLPKGQYPLASADGIHWNFMSTEKINPSASDTQFSVFWDERIDKYVQYTRMKPKNPAQVEYYRRQYDGFEGRAVDCVVGRAVSDDFIHWGDEQIVLAPDETDRAVSPEGLSRLDFYGGNMSAYSEAPEAYIGLPNAYYHWKYDMSRKWWSGKPVQLPSAMDIQLVTSRDGIRWNRSPRRKPIIRLGPEGTFWSKTIWPSNTIRVGDELWIYFAGLDVSHKEQSLIKSHGARGRAVLRLDGFISADAAYSGGELVTKPLLFDGTRLQLNVDTGAGGTVRLEMLDASGKAHEGYGLDESDEINGNYIRVNAGWRGSPEVGRLAGKPVKLRFVMRDSRLYSFQFLP